MFLENIIRRCKLVVNLSLMAKYGSGFHRTALECDERPRGRVTYDVEMLKT